MESRRGSQARGKLITTIVVNDEHTPPGETWLINQWEYRATAQLINWEKRRRWNERNSDMAAEKMLRAKEKHVIDKSIQGLVDARANKPKFNELKFGEL